MTRICKLARERRGGRVEPDEGARGGDRFVAPPSEREDKK
jgi:hypothetical protein